MRNIFEYIDDEHLEHHGILGMKWGIRRFQNKDGSLTNVGKKRYQNSDGSLTAEGKERYMANGSKHAYIKKPTKEDLEVLDRYRKNLDRKAASEFDSIQSITDRKQRAKAQTDYLAKATDAEADDYAYACYGKLCTEYNNKSGDWYSGTSVSKAHADAKKDVDAKYAIYRKVDRDHGYDWKNPDVQKAKEAYERSKEKVDGVVLKDIGFEDTPTNRELIRWIWQID